MEYFKPFFVKIAGCARDDDHTSAHDQIIAPLLQNASPPMSIMGAKIASWELLVAWSTR